VWWYYVIGEPKRPKGFKAFLRNKLGEPPVLSSRVNVKNTSQNMQSFLENNGYFHSGVTGDTTNSGYFVKAHYNATVYPQYSIKSITWVKDSSVLLKDLTSFNRRTLLKVGNPYKLSDIQSERDRLDLRLKTKGYYYFTPDYIMAYADSTIGDHKVDLFLNIKNTTPEMAKHPYTINKIRVFPNYSLLFPPPDTSKVGMMLVDSIYIRDTVKNFKPVVFTRAITYRPGQLYSSRDQNTSLNRLINLGTFKFVKNRFDTVKDTTDPYRLNAYYYLTSAKKKSIQAEIDGFSKDNRYLGTQVSVNWKNRNTFKGAELLTIKAYGGFEISLGDSLKNNNNYRIGGEASLNFPRFVVPFFRIKESNLYPPNTKMSLGYEYFIKQSLYSKNVFHLQYEFNWKETSNKQHSFAPFSISYLKAANITDSFYKQAAITPAILLNVYDEAILGSYYSYTYNSVRPFAKNQVYFNGSVDVSGNIAGLITGAKSFREKTIFGTPFAQYVKFDAEMRYTRKLKNNVQWANRVQVGIGIPYNNSSLLPFSKQYVIGGPSSLRGFPVRHIGPGSYLPTEDDQRFFQIIGGDYKLLGNTELRVPLAGALGGAIFFDAGNIWTKDTLLFGPKGKLTKNFLNDIAVTGGVGLRLDVNILLIRFDLGIPLRKPYLPNGQKWVFDKIDFSSRAWRRENLILNIAIGYPF
jgi:outer membrane protein assembly factor BamA